MNTQEIQAQKLNLINWISQLKDVSLIDKLKNIQEEYFEIPQWQKDIVLDRIENSTDKDYIPWSEAKKQL